MENKETWIKRKLVFNILAAVVSVIALVLVVTVDRESSGISFAQLAIGLAFILFGISSYFEYKISGHKARIIGGVLYLLIGLVNIIYNLI